MCGANIQFVTTDTELCKIRNQLGTYIATSFLASKEWIFGDYQLPHMVVFFLCWITFAAEYRSSNLAKESGSCSDGENSHLQPSHYLLVEIDRELKWYWEWGFLFPLGDDSRLN